MYFLIFYQVGWPRESHNYGIVPKDFESPPNGGDKHSPSDGGRREVLIVE